MAPGRVSMDGARPPSLPPSSSSSTIGAFLSVVHRCTACVFSFGFCCSKVMMRAIGPLLATVALSLIFFVLLVYFSYIYPSLTSPRHHNLSPHTANLITAVGLYLLLLTLFHYLSTMFIAPGHPPPLSYWTPERRALLAYDPELHSKSGDHRFCRSCDVIKPMRTHHCSLCNTCVLKMGTTHCSAALPPSLSHPVRTTDSRVCSPSSV